MAVADMVMNPQQFGSNPADIQICMDSGLIRKSGLES